MTATLTPAVSAPAPTQIAPAHPLRVAIIIVHYKTPRMLKDCIDTVVRSTGFSLHPTQPDHIIIIDNNSGPEHLAELADLHQNPNITLIESPANLGFAGANNLAIRHLQKNGGADYYLLLNPDTLVRPDAFATLLEFLDHHPNAACVGPRLEGPDATPQQSAFTNPNPLSELLRGASIGPLTKLFQRSQVYGPIHNQPVPTDWLAGACVLMRSSMLEKAGLLDDRYFMYFEEVDYFRRAKKLGQQAWYEPAAHVVHLVGQSSGITVAQNQKRLPPYWFESRHRYFRKHYGYLGMLLADYFWFNGFILDRLRKLFTGTSHAAHAKYEFRDLLRHSFHQLLHPFAHAGGKK